MTGYTPPAYLSAIDPSEVRVDIRAHQPPGGHGFRKGTWTVLYKGDRWRVFANPPHAAETAVQHRIVEATAARAIGAMLHDLHREG